jgi:hypothetical protein
VNTLSTDVPLVVFVSVSCYPPTIIPTSTYNYNSLAHALFFAKGRKTYIKSWYSTPQITREKNWNKKYIIIYPNSSIISFPNGFPRTPEPKCSPYAKSIDQPQNIGHATRPNASKSLKEYRQLHRRVRHRMQIHHLETLLFCDHRRWDQCPRVAVLIEGSPKAPLPCR